MLIRNGFTNIVVFHSVFDLPIFKHCAGQPSSIAQAGVEMPHIPVVVVVVHILIPEYVYPKEQAHQWVWGPIMIVIDERMAQFWGCQPQTYGDWSDTTSGIVNGRYTHLLHHVLQRALNMRQYEVRVRNEIVMEYFLDLFWKSQTHHGAQCLPELGFRPIILGRDLFPMWISFVVGAALRGQPKGWPSSLAPAAFRSEFLR